MSTHLASIQAPIIQELTNFNHDFKKIMQNEVGLLDKVGNYILQKRGKQFRPLSIFLAAGMHGKINAKTYRAATIIELFHTATLVHDDIIDEAIHRRNKLTTHKLFNNKIAVLFGDHLFAKALDLAISHGDIDLLKLINSATKDMSQGEVIQMQENKKITMTEQQYFTIIQKKTASLIAASFASGACSSFASTKQVEKMYTIGKQVGIAFQLQDDLLDYTGQNIGKKLAKDVQNHQVTLPLLYALKKFPMHKQTIQAIMLKNILTKQDVDNIINFVKDADGISYTKKKIKFYQQKALDSLATYPNTDYKEAMHKLITYNDKRNF